MKGKKSMNTTRTRVGTLIGEGAVFDGDLSAPETIRIDGTVNGNCKCNGDVVLGEKGQVQGNISAENVVVSGTIEGDVTASGKMEILSTGKLTGNITAKSLVVDENGSFDGRCIMATSPKASYDKPVQEKREDFSEEEKGKNHGKRGY